MYRNILVPVDLSDNNLAAVEAAASMLDTDGKATLLHVIETIEDVPFDDIKDFYSSLEEKAHRVMDGLVRKLQQPTERFDRRVVYGRRLREVLTAASELSADLIVLHSHRVVPGSSATGIGTLSHEIAIMAEVPVLLVK